MYVSTYIHIYICIYLYIYVYIYKCTYMRLYRSRRRSDLKYLDFQIYPISEYIFRVSGTPFTLVKIYLKFRGLPWTRVWYLRRLLWKLVWNFGSGKYFKSDLPRTWYVYICIYIQVCADQLAAPVLQRVLTNPRIREHVWGGKGVGAGGDGSAQVDGPRSQFATQFTIFNR